MKAPGLRHFVAALAVLLGVWAGARMYLDHVVPKNAGVAVPAGVASAPDPGDGVLADAPLPRPVVPVELPDFALNDLSNKPISVSVWRGRSLVINFWATWCAPCRHEVPLLKALATEWAGRGLTVVGIAVDYKDKVQQFADQFKIDYPLLIGEQDALDVAAKFGMPSPAFPFTVFTDRRGRVVALFVGELHKPQVDFILSVVENLNRDKEQLPEARRRIAAGLEALAENQAG
ncbi:MAG TPA: TlpA disulfide reductase family protein [Steroidobacteraceae bacterium]|jgi:thiol-disulfide isomerase/thioredoxin